MPANTGQTDALNTGRNTESKSFVREHKISLRENAKVLLGNANIFKRMQKFCEETQSFSRERN